VLATNASKLAMDRLAYARTYQHSLFPSSGQVPGNEANKAHSSKAAAGKVRPRPAPAFPYVLVHDAPPGNLPATLHPAATYRAPSLDLLVRACDDVSSLSSPLCACRQAVPTYVRTACTYTCHLTSVTLFPGLLPVLTVYIYREYIRIYVHRHVMRTYVPQIVVSSTQVIYSDMG